MRIAERIIRKVLSKAEITPNGNAPWDIKINDPRFYGRVLVDGSLGLGESYMEGWWDCQHLDQFFERVLKTGEPLLAALNPIAVWLFIKSRLMNLASARKAFVVGEQHYDLGNSLFRVMLDQTTMSYSCGYWKHASALDGAQVAKLDLICRKLGLKRGQRVLDIGCGWGSFAHYAATHYGAKVVGLTVSKEQVALAQQRCKGLPVEIRLQDYRELNEQFDHVVSIGMFEHVGPKNYRTYMRAAEKCLRPEGLFLLHTIGVWGRILNSPDPWIQKYIFPVGEIPARRQIRRSSEGLLSIRDWHEFGKYYDPTLMAWHSRFVAAWDELQAEYGQQVGGRFRRMWEYYLLACAGAFRARNLELWQIALSHPGVHQGYHLVR
jgi:cyclopropane-fatty-acyl-phospholipid synthase